MQHEDGAVHPDPDPVQHEDGTVHPDPGPAHQEEALVTNPGLVQQEESRPGMKSSYFKPKFAIRFTQRLSKGFYSAT